MTLHWDLHSTIEQLSQGDLDNLTIVGWNGSSWEAISSSVDDFTSEDVFSGEESSLSFGSITTDEAIVPDDYDVITFGALGGESRNSSTRFGSELNGSEKIEFTLFPNPTFDLADVKLDYDMTDVTSEATLVILNANGETLYKRTLLEDKDIVQLSYTQATSGLYHIGIITENGSRVFKPAIVSR